MRFKCEDVNNINNPTTSCTVLHYGLFLASLLCVDVVLHIIASYHTTVSADLWPRTWRPAWGALTLANMRSNFADDIYICDIYVTSSSITYGIRHNFLKSYVRVRVCECCTAIIAVWCCVISVSPCDQLETTELVISVYSSMVVVRRRRISTNPLGVLGVAWVVWYS